MDSICGSKYIRFIIIFHSDGAHSLVLSSDVMMIRGNYIAASFCNETYIWNYGRYSYQYYIYDLLTLDYRKHVTNTNCTIFYVNYINVTKILNIEEIIKKQSILLAFSRQVQDGVSISLFSQQHQFFMAPC